MDLLYPFVEGDVFLPAELLVGEALFEVGEEFFLGEQGSLFLEEPARDKALL